jgi:ferredoxin
MADSKAKNPQNVPGPWYVDTSCIGCALCTGTAPDTFSMNDEGSAAYVAKQPGTAGEKEAATQALSDCPVGAIGQES